MTRVDYHTGTSSRGLDGARPVYETGLEPAPVVPALQGFYEKVVPLSWPLVRLAAGWGMLVHGWLKIMGGTEKAAGAFASMQFSNPTMLAVVSTWLEFLGGLFVILGLFTRFWAAALAIELGYIFLVYWGNGFSWLNRGYEYVLLWGAVYLAIALRGGGPYSLDRRLGREL